jgi:hypothetical protein
MSIHTVGDSHSFNGWSGIINHHLGAILCYSFGIEKLKRCDIRNFHMKDGDTIIFCFGEIDCRCHIHKHLTETTTYQNIINNIVCNYIDAIKFNIEMAQIQFKNVCIYNVVPPSKKYTIWENPIYPFLGSDEERKLYSLYFNTKLKEKCTENNFIFFDIYDKYTDGQGFLRSEFSDGNVHIRDGRFITKFMKEKNI